MGDVCEDPTRATRYGEKNILLKSKKPIGRMWNVHLVCYNLVLIYIVHGPARFLDEETLNKIMTSCIIMHNMIVEDERDEHNDFNYDTMGENVKISHESTPELDEFIANYQTIKDRSTHTQLQDDLVEHLWQHYGDQN